MLIDTHCHIYSEYYDDIDFVLNKANDSGVKYVISSGVNNIVNNELLLLSKNYQNMFITLGIHPEEVTNYNKSDLAFIKDNSNNSKVVAIGEIGLDYHYSDTNKDLQKELFRKQLDCAKDCNLPVVIHSREATKDTLDILKEYPLKGVIHCFSGSFETAMEYIKMGYKIGVGGVVTFKNSNLKEVIKKIGLENIVLETDSPYLSPEPYRGKPNSPGHIKEIAIFLSELFDIPFSQVEEITNQNALCIFDKLKIQ